MNYIKTTIAKADYRQVQPMFGKYVVRVLAIEKDDMVNCVECMIGHEPTKAEIKSIEADAEAYYLPIEKATKIAKIEAYDTSEAVNGFFFNGQPMWIDKATRVGLVNATDSAILLGKENITFGISGVSVTLPCAAAKAMLAQLEMYALDCYNVTLKHKTDVADFGTITEVETYDITAGYPPKLEF